MDIEMDMEMDMELTPLSTSTILLRARKAYSITGLCVFVNRIHKEMKMGMVTRQGVWLTLYTCVDDSDVSLGRLTEHLPRQDVQFCQDWWLIRETH